MTIEDFKKINKCNIDIQSFLLLLDDKKPALRIGFSKTIQNEIADLCKNFGLELLVKRMEDVFIVQAPSDSMLCYISKTKRNTQEIYKAEKNNDSILFGNMLGYPECCINNFFNNKYTKEDPVELASENSKKKYFFQCNNIFHFESKLEIGRNVKTYQDNYDNLFSNCEKYFLIKHMPCSFNCVPSKKIGNKTLALIKSEIPELAEEIIWATKKIILYFDYFNWIVFDGVVKENKIFFTEILSIHSLFPIRSINKIKNGDKVVIEKNMISIYSQEEKIYSFRYSKCNILNFSN